MRLSIITPVYNEETTIKIVLSKLVETLPDLYEVIVVDDGSTDMTVPLAREFAESDRRVHIVELKQNQGKTAALRKGFGVSKGDIVLVQDADLEYDPRDIPDLLEPIQSGVADGVYGSRFLVRRAARVLYFKHYLANRVITFLSNLFTDLNFTDVETGYKVFRGDIIRSMVIQSKGFGFEIEVTAKVAKLGCRVYEVPISYFGRTYEEGKKISFADGLAALYYLVRFNLF